MKKVCLIFLAALCLLWPASSWAETTLPAFLNAVGEGFTTGIAAGAKQIAAANEQDLALSLESDSTRIEESKTVTLTLTASNPRAVETPVSLTLKLPARLAVGQTAVWEATLPPAQTDDSGSFVPSVTTFTREVTLMPGGDSEDVTIEAEMSMGTRFYRASTPLSLCVADVSASAQATGIANGRIHPGDTFSYEVQLVNDGAAPKDVAIDMTLPDDVAIAGELAEGFVRVGNRLRGSIHVDAAAEQPGATVFSVPLTIGTDALDEDEDASRLLTGQLRVDGTRVALPRIQVCGPKISARLLPEADSLKEGETMALRVVVVNAGLSDADVSLSCVLPDGLSLVTEEASAKATAEEAAMEATPAQAVTQDDAPLGAQPAAVLSVQEVQDGKTVVQENGTLIFNLRMDAAQETDGGVTANTRVIDLLVRADAPQQNIKERLLGATVAWTTDGGQTQIGEAVAVRVYKPMFLGLTGDEWSGIFWAGLLLVVTVSCLYAAVCADNRRDDYVCD